ncbi:MAG TPA: EF-hand domain-containing protein [Blastocatellia bacterium]|nr:EF-hand domain-containing protein [Blastocatellia bacterium]
MKKFFEMLMLAAVLAVGAASVYAQDPQEPRSDGSGSAVPMRQPQFQMPTFADLDKNKDKKITRDELPSQWPPQAFDRMDENKDGFIDEAEFDRTRRAFRMGGGGPQLGERMSRFLDGDKNGKVSREEFAKLNQMFDALDTDKNGELTNEEMGRFFQAMSEAQAQATGGVDVNSLFQNVDKNKDGKITPDEMTDERMFKALDLNKDGAVPRDEAEQALKQLNERRRNRPQ